MPSAPAHNRPAHGSSAEPSRIAEPLAGTAYRTVRFLGQGAMGQVVLAERVLSGREPGCDSRAGGGALQVVVKLLHTELVGRLDLVDRMPTGNRRTLPQEPPRQYPGTRAATRVLPRFASAIRREGPAKGRVNVPLIRPWTVVLL